MYSGSVWGRTAGERERLKHLLAKSLKSTPDPPKKQKSEIEVDPRCHTSSLKLRHTLEAFELEEDVLGSRKDDSDKTDEVFRK